jgi:hypothetical protein
MGFLRVPDRLPSPQAYLRAGLPRPTTSVTWSRGWQGVVCEQGDLPVLADVAQDSAPGGRTFTLVAESGNPVAVVSALSHRFLSRPARRWARDSEILQVERLPSGVLDITYGPRRPPLRDQRPDPIDPATARVVTLDHSVALAGIDPALFGADDALFVSAMIAMEMAVTTGTRPATRELFTSYGTWDLTTPVPIDEYVLRIYQQLASPKDRDPLVDGTLDRTDLICAATAILYDAPMYTTKPEAYKGLRNGLRVIAYGPVRSKAARTRTPGGPQAATPGPSPEAIARMTPSNPHEAAEALRDAYASGKAYGPATQALLEAALDAPEAIIRVVTDILVAVHDDADPTWRIALLDHAVQLAPAVERVPHGRAALLSALAQLDTMRHCVGGDPTPVRQATAALAAYGHWGRWPEDASDEVLDDLEDGEDDPATLRWYDVFLAMAGVPDDVIATERACVYQGTRQPSRARIEELRTARG